jgi:hypothetical protein
MFLFKMIHQLREQFSGNSLLPNFGMRFADDGAAKVVCS